MEGNASVYQVYSVNRIIGEERAEVIRAWGPGAGWLKIRGEDGGTQSVRGNYKPLKGQI